MSKDKHAEPGYLDAIMPPRGLKDTMPALPVPGIPVFRPGDLTREDRKQMNHDLIVNRGAIRQANLANKSAASALKYQLLSGNGAASTTEMQIDDKTEDGKSEDVADAPNIGLSEPRVTPLKRKADEMIPATAEPDEPKSSDGEPNLDTVR